jgi:SPP1 gp7 family putative phage head morphogenesis protein
MKSQDYWQKRSEAIAEGQYKKADDYLNGLADAYGRAKGNIQKEIEVFYSRYAENNEISYAEAVKKLTPAELKSFRMTLDEFIAKAKDNEDGRWTQELNNVYYKSRISRLDALLTQIQHEIEMMTDKTVSETSSLLNDTYADTYYRNMHSIQSGLGFGIDFGKLDKDKVNAATTEKWLGANYSSRIWDDKGALIQGLQTTIPQALIRGEGLRRTVEVALGKLQSSEYNVRRIIKTEQSYLVHKATASGYVASGVVNEYEFLATLDKKTSEVCRGTDKQVFDIKDMRVGVNYPPLHPNCRSTVTPYFEGNVIKRTARGVDGESYDVPGDMSYKDWYKEYVANDPESVLAEKMYKNKGADQRQFANYKSVLGKNAPKDITAFQQLKYTDSEKWRYLKVDFTRRNSLLKDSSLKLPNVYTAEISDKKFTDYLFGGKHEEGLIKGNLFNSRLGYNANNYSKLLGEIRDSSSLYPVKNKGSDQYGDKYEQQIILYGLIGKPTNVLVGWRTLDKRTWLSSVYIKELK